MTSATVFGLDVRADCPLSYLQGARAGPTGRELEVSMSELAEAPEWPEGARLISDQRQPDGTVNFQIEASAEAGYRIWGPTYGDNVLSADGRRLAGVSGSGGLAAWQRLLIAQVLPFAAVLHGLEVLHASAVSVGAGAVALVGPSGSGKTSVALALTRRGAGFLTDDVLSLEQVDGELIGHPGTPVAGVDQAEAKRQERNGGSPEQEVLSVNSRERVARIGVGAQPMPLGALFFLDRRTDGPSRPRFEPAANSQLLLASTFNLLLADPRRLERLLDVCATVARGRVERIVIGADVDPTDLGDAVLRRIGAA